MSGSLLCTYADYQRLTRDKVTLQIDVDPLTLEAEQLIASKLQRAGISLASQTERLRIYYDPAATGLFGPSGWVFPSATPVVDVTNPTGTTVGSDGQYVMNVPPDTDPIGLFGSPIQLDRFCTLTYDGGWTHTNVPHPIMAAIARVARNLQRPFTPGEAGLTSVRQGDSSLTMGGVGLATEVIDPVTWRSIRGWRKRQVG